MRIPLFVFVLLGVIHAFSTLTNIFTLDFLIVLLLAPDPTLFLDSKNVLGLKTLFCSLIGLTWLQQLFPISPRFISVLAIAPAVQRIPLFPENLSEYTSTVMLDNLISTITPTLHNCTHFLLTNNLHALIC